MIKITRYYYFLMLSPYLPAINIQIGTIKNGFECEQLNFYLFLSAFNTGITLKM